jgi:hypothetical protein
MNSKKVPHNVSETLLPVTETNVASEPPNTTPESKQRVSETAQAWIVLFIHGACSIALALAIAFGLNRYKAGDKSSPHRVEGKLLLRVADVTTLVSVALVVVKIIVGVWSTIVLWGFGNHMFNHKSAPSQEVWKMIRWRLPPELQTLKSIPKGFQGWIISVTVIILFIQAFTGPILTGSISWNAAFDLSKKAVSVNSVDEKAAFGVWHWYNAQGGFDKKAYLRVAAGYANLAWADTSTVDAKGKSNVGNGCRSVMNDDGLSRNSSLVDAILPCIKINSIHWYRNESEVKKDDWSDVTGDDLTLVGDDPFGYYRGGVTLVYDKNNLRKNPGSTDKPPPPNKFSGVLTVALMLARRNYEADPPCSKLPNTVFGNISPLPYLTLSTRSTAGDENCFLVGKIDFTAGVAKSSRATYIGPRIVESQTTIQDVEFQANPWVQEAIWLLPDLLTMLAVSNVSLPPTFENIDGYVSGIVRQGYLAAWDMLHRSFDEQGPLYQGYPAQGRLVADVSFARVFAWLGISLFMTLCGVFALVLVLEPADLMPPGGNREVMNAGATEMQDKVAGAYVGTADGG